MPERPRRWTIGPILLPLLAACGGAPSPSGAAAAAAPAASGAGARKAPAGAGAPRIAMVTPSRLVPDLELHRNVMSSAEGYRRVLIDRMRIIARDDGTLERASELLPSVPVKEVELPSRLGGGYLFWTAPSPNSVRKPTQIWRAPAWLGKLEPLVQLDPAAQVVPGFDRLYVQLATTSWIAIDAQSGDQLPLAPLPPAAGYGFMAFADGWRAVVETDLRGPLATFDAGLTWRPIGIKERVTSIPIVDGDPLVVVNGGQYTLSPRGVVTFRPDAPPELAEDEGVEEERSRPPGPLGRRPLRAAIEDGWPDSDATAVIARGGALARVSLRDGAVLATAENAYPDRLASCHAIHLGRSAPEAPGRPGGESGIGFVCGEREGPTSLYAFVPPLAMRPLMRFSRPRFVAPSGNGAVVIRGSCADAPPALGDTRTYCVRAPDGATREIRVKGDLGAERVVALSDGRVAVIVPPRPGATGQLTLLDGAKMIGVPLRLPAEPRSVAKEVRRGMWLDGFEERAPGVLGGWVEAGGPVVGIAIALDGKVTAGPLRDDAGGAILSGRFGLSRAEGGGAAETTDGGMSWTELVLPETREDAEDPPSRACGPAGCVLSGWIRVGWGSPETRDDLSQPPPTEPPSVAWKPPSALRLGCVEAGQATPPLPAERPKPAPPPPPPRSRTAPQPLGVTAFSPFRNTAPPALATDEIGFENGSLSDPGLWIYAWGRRGADWSRAGRWMARFDDRFDAAGGVRTTATSASPWTDEVAANDGVGRGTYGGQQWAASLDPSGRAALFSICQRGNACSLFGAGAGQPLLPLRDLAGRTALPRPSGAVRVGETWFFLSPQSERGGNEIVLWRADLGVARPVATMLRPQGPLSELWLVRRALGGGLGIMFMAPPEPGARAGVLHVFPIDPESGQLGDPIALGRKDTVVASAVRCGAQQDGWQVELRGSDVAPVIELRDGLAGLEAAELRLRIDPGAVCLDGVAARMNGAFVKSAAAAGTGAAGEALAGEAEGIPLAATERGTGRRWTLRCSRR